MKIILSDGGHIQFSDKAYERMIELGMTVTRFDSKGGIEIYEADIIEHKGKDYGNYSFVDFTDTYSDEFKKRANPIVIKVVEELGEESYLKRWNSGKLRVVEIPFDNINDIEIYSNLDGIEHVRKKKEYINLVVVDEFLVSQIKKIAKLKNITETEAINQCIISGVGTITRRHGLYTHDMNKEEQ